MGRGDQGPDSGDTTATIAVAGMQDCNNRNEQEPDMQDISDKIQEPDMQDSAPVIKREKTELKVQNYRPKKSKRAPNRSRNTQTTYTIDPATNTAIPEQAPILRVVGEFGENRPDEVIHFPPHQEGGDNPVDIIPPFQENQLPNNIIVFYANPNNPPSSNRIPSGDSGLPFGLPRGHFRGRGILRGLPPRRGHRGQNT